jgi:signal transduction histidine kinase
VQALSHRLHPARVEYLGLAAAAGALCRELSSHSGVEVGYSAEAIPEDLSGRVAVCLYRVLQEALHNAIKHSGARKAEVSLLGLADRIELTVHDLGVGFDPVATQVQGLGLTSMKERLTAVRGQLVIRSAPQQGTTISVHVPLAGQ